MANEQTPTLVGTPPFVLPISAATTNTGPGSRQTYAVDGSAGLQTIVGLAETNLVDVPNAAGSGTVVVMLPGQGASEPTGTISKGGRLDAVLTNIQGVQLGTDDAAVYGNALMDGPALVYGGTGHLDFHAAGAADAVIQGSTSSNFIVGDASNGGPIGSTLFYGHGGTDIMVAGRGVNTMVAGSGPSSSDTFVGLHDAYPNDATTQEQDTIYGHGGTVTVFGGVGTQVLYGGSGTNTLVGSTTAFTDSSGDVSKGINVLHGGTGADSGTDLFYAGIGVNLLYEGSGTDVFAGGAGTDHIVGGAGRSFIYGGSGTETIDTGAGNQYLMAGSGTTVFNDIPANLTAGRLDWIDGFKGAGAPGQPGTYIDLPEAAKASTTFQSQNGGTLILAAATTGGGQAGVFVAHTSVATVQAQTFFTL